MIPLSNRTVKSEPAEERVVLSRRVRGQHQITVPPVGGSPSPSTVEVNDPVGAPTSAPPDPSAPPSADPQPEQSGDRRTQILNDLHALQESINQVCASVFGVNLPTEDLIEVSTKCVDAMGSCVADNTSEVVSNLLGSPPKRHGALLSNRVAQEVLGEMSRKISAAAPEDVVIKWLGIARSLVEAGIPPLAAVNDARRVAEQNHLQGEIQAQDWEEMWQGIAGEIGSSGEGGGVGVDGGAEQGATAAPPKPALRPAPAAEMGDEKLLIPQGQIDAEPVVSADWIINEYELAKKIKDPTKRQQRIDRLRQIAQGYKDLGENPRLGRLK